MKAIETSYNGYRFRSRLEARWAVFFDALQLPYEYEKQGYEFKDNAGCTHRYLPDFWLPTLNLWVEVKGILTPAHMLENRLPGEEAWLLDELSNGTGCAAMFVGPNADAFTPWFGWDTNDSSGGKSPYPWEAMFVTDEHGNGQLYVPADTDSRVLYNCSDFGFDTYEGPINRAALLRARNLFKSARFEHGVVGGYYGR